MTTFSIYKETITSNGFTSELINDRYTDRNEANEIALRLKADAEPNEWYCVYEN